MVDALADAHFSNWPAAIGSLVVAIVSAALAVWLFGRHGS